MKTPQNIRQLFRQILENLESKNLTYINLEKHQGNNSSKTLTKLETPRGRKKELTKKKTKQNKDVREKTQQKSG